MADPVGKIDLNIFGAVTASVSHEIKNRMAVINEHAGLMEDRIHMAEMGSDMNIERMKQSASKIKQQITLTDSIITNMNRFAHSVDKARQQIDLHDAVMLADALFKRIASAKEISIEAPKPDSPVILETSFFHLLGLIWMCLKAAIDIAPAKSTVTIMCGHKGGDAGLYFVLDKETGGDINETILDDVKMLANALAAEARLDLEKNTIIVRFL
jgi:C4-dicarboxylate-specific signal transduction histidine kinase